MSKVANKKYTLQELKRYHSALSRLIREVEEKDPAVVKYPNGVEVKLTKTSPRTGYMKKEKQEVKITSDTTGKLFKAQGQKLPPGESGWYPLEKLIKKFGDGEIKL
jgi:hypothetical protein